MGSTELTAEWNACVDEETESRFVRDSGTLLGNPVWWLTCGVRQQSVHVKMLNSAQQSANLSLGAHAEGTAVQRKWFLFR
jgi:hypothetical protein